MSARLAIRLCFILTLLLGLGALLLAWQGVPMLGRMHAVAVVTEANADMTDQEAAMDASVRRGHEVYRGLWFSYGMALTAVSLVGLAFTRQPPERLL